MKMTFRWYGSQMDPIPLRYIKQIPNMSGRGQFPDGPACRGPLAHRAHPGSETGGPGRRAGAGGDRERQRPRGHQAGLPGRDAYIDRYRTTIERLGQAGVKVICYNFMPVFDWTRSDLFKPRADGATVLAYDQR